jgi:hypothetical protein
MAPSILMFPIVVAVVIHTGNKHDSLYTSGKPVSAHLTLFILLSVGKNIDDLYRVAVTPKLPAVPVVADSVTELTPRIYLPESAAGINEFKGSILEALIVVPIAVKVRFPVLLSL